MKRISIFGSGYVGLVTASCLAAIGHEVVCVDLNGAWISQAILLKVWRTPR